MSDTIETLTERVRGRVITASDRGYDAARAVYNAMYDRRPRAVVQCTDSAGVMAVIAAARDGGVDLAIRGGGHSVAGFGTVDDGLIIDLSPMRGVRVEPVKKVARIGGGATLGNVDHVEVMPFPALQSAFDDFVPTGMQNYWKADFAAGLTDEAIVAHVEHGKRTPHVHSSMHLHPINGAARKRPMTTPDGDQVAT